MHRACRRIQLVSTPAVTPSAVSDAVLPGTHTDLLRCRELLCTRRHRSLGIPRLGKSPLPVRGSLALTTTMCIAASLSLWRWLLTRSWSRPAWLCQPMLRPMSPLQR